MERLALINRPIAQELEEFKALFKEELCSTTNPQLQQMLEHVRNRSGKMMRPVLVLLIAKLFGKVSMNTLHAAVTLELLHTASLVHDDVVDDSNERRGQPSVNALFNNKLSVLAGDYLLSTALLQATLTGNMRIVDLVATLGQQLADGEILQLSNVSNLEFSEDVYFDIIQKKTASLFRTCAQVGALSVGAGEEEVVWSGEVGEIIGIIFQIKDDIFDYMDANSTIGKPTGNDMHEGKLTLPVLHALITSKNEDMVSLARRVKCGKATEEEIARLVTFTREAGGIDYANEVMHRLEERAYLLLTQCTDEAVQQALSAYVQYVVQREK